MFVFVIQQRETALDIARRKDNDELITLLTNVKVWETRRMHIASDGRVIDFLPDNDLI